MEEQMSSFLDTFFQNAMMKFFDSLFSHVLKETEGIESAPRFTSLPMVFPLYQPKVGQAVVKILELVGSSVDEFYESIKEKIKDRRNLRTFLSRLGAKFLLEGKASDTLYFLSVTSRIFALLSKTEPQNSDMYIRECVKALQRTSSGNNSLSGFVEILPLIQKILKNENQNWQDEFRNLSCGDLSYYFPAESEAACA